MPKPKPRWGLGSRAMSNSSGFSNARGSWFAAPSSGMIGVPFLIVNPWRVTSSVEYWGFVLWIGPR